MKRLFFLILLFATTVLSFAQETVKPSYGVTTERLVVVAQINETFYKNVVVELKAAGITDLFADGVKITVKDENGKKIYKKRFSKSYLYAFSDGTIEVGKGNALTNMILYKDKTTGNWLMRLRDKGIY